MITFYIALTALILMALQSMLWLFGVFIPAWVLQIFIATCLLFILCIARKSE